MGAKKAVVVVGIILFAVTGAAVAAQGVAKGEAKPAAQIATGTVTAVTPESRTLVVEARLSGQPWILGVEVPEGLNITAAGKTKKLEDLKAGERVRLSWIRGENRLVAEAVSVIGAKAP